MNYDVIGDIHGCADELEALLRKLGYREQGGAFRQAGRTAVFLGDFIDAGPRQLETLAIVRPMVDAGAAVAVMGNHEFNAIAWTLPDGTGGYLRDHGKHRKEHAAFLAAVEGKPKVHQQWVDWFLTLPLWLDLPELRAVHACWHPEQLAVLAPRLRPAYQLDRALMDSAARKPPRHERGTPRATMFEAVEIVLKGLEVTLPKGKGFRDPSGKYREEARVRWWDQTARSLRQAAIIPGLEDRSTLPDDPIPGYEPLGYPDEKPVFVGHYKLEEPPAPGARRVACLDYGYGRNAMLCAYRYDGEPVLDAAKFTRVTVPQAADRDA